ncbi:MAG: sulfotransferase domain-containing protein, partial [Planctomycetota bacterium]
MRLSDFLIIGAMKAGTTSLYRDLLDNPAVFMPVEKEPANLLSDEVCTSVGRRAYARHFERARPDQVCGEATTGCAKLPDIPGVPQRAKRVLGPKVKAIYLVREPVSRIISQHHHERSSRKISCDIDTAVREHSRFIDFSRYAMQITPWLEALGPEQVMLVRFETYVAQRLETVAA